MPDVGPFWVLPVESSEGTLVRTHDSDSDWRRPRALSTRSLQKNGNIRSHFVDLRGEAMPATGNARSSASAFVRRRLSGLSDSMLGKAAASIPAMQPASLLADWERAESQVVSAKKRVSDQIEAIAWLSWFGDDAVEAKALLRKFEIALAKHLSDREQLRMQLALSQGTDARANPRHAQTRPLARSQSRSRLSA
jgi:hypothetical protein